MRLPKGDALRERGMGIGLADQEEVAAVVERQRTQGLVPGEVIAEQGDAVRGHMLGVCVHPPCARHTLAVLCVIDHLEA